MMRQELPGRLMVGQRVLVPLVGVRVPARQQIMNFSKNSKKNPQENLGLEEFESSEDIVFSDTDAGDACVQKLQKIKEKLKVCEKEKQEYLQGWQRERADSANEKKRHKEELEKAIQRATEEILQRILPAVDSFDMAMQDKSFEGLEEKWKAGIEYIYKQLQDALSGMRVTSFAKEGDKFDLNLHHAAKTESTDKEEKDGVIKAVLSKGYKYKDRVIRVAQVVVYKYDKDSVDKKTDKLK